MNFYILPQRRPLLLKKTALILIVCMLIVCAFPAAWAENDLNLYEQYLIDGGYPSLSERYRGVFSVGVSIEGKEIAGPASQVIAQCFDSLSCTSMMKANYLLARNATKKLNDPERAALYFDQTDKILSFAQEHGLRVRAHALIGFDQAPKWFFTENWAQGASAKLVDRDTMIRRMENYIRDEMAYINTNYPGLVYAWDVVEEAVEPAQGDPLKLRVKSNLWYQVIGGDYVELAFSFARKYAAEGQQLLYCDSDCFREEKGEAVYEYVKRLSGLGLIDGVGLHGHLGLESPTTEELSETIQKCSSLGLTVHLTEVDVKTADNSSLGQMRLAARYKELFEALEQMRKAYGVSIGSVTFANLTDDQSELNSSKEQVYPLLFDEELRPKAAYFGALQDAPIPDKDDEEALIDRLKALNLYEPPQEEPLMIYKTLDQHNPVMVQRFGADPWAMEYNGRVYLYMTGDEPMFDKDSHIQTNTYGNITTLRVLSSDDLVNWQDHGDIRAAGRQGAAKWASNSWAPCAAWKNIDGQDKFFLYFANSAGGIGVLTADDPAGPFSDPLGKPLISRATPTCASVTWLFDPAVLMDDDGQAYLYFGGGIPEGRQAAPGTARAVKLGADMISLAGDPVAIDAPWLFEDSGINKIGDTYVYSYCSNFQVPSSGSKEGFHSGEIVYMTSSDPLGPFMYGGRVLKNPGTYFGVGGNNHHCMFQFKGNWYITYHAATLDRQKGWNAGYRSTFVDDLKIGKNGLPALSEGTYDGVSQIQAFDPYRPVPAVTAAAMAGVTVTQSGDGLYAQSTSSGGWVGLSKVDFGESGASYVSLRWKTPKEGTLSILLDDWQAQPAAQITLTKTDLWQGASFSLPERITGTHDLYFRLDQPDICLDQWRFQP